MLTIKTNFRSTISYARLFTSSSIFSVCPWTIHSKAMINNNKRYRTTSSSAPYNHHQHHNHHHRTTGNKKNSSSNQLHRLFQAVDVKPMMLIDQVDTTSSENVSGNVGEELTGGKPLERSKTYDQ
jgi:hypothetical protein